MKTNLQKTFAALLLCAFALNLRAQVNTAVMVDASGTLIAPITGGTASLDALTVNRAGTLSIDGSTLTGTASSNDLRIHNVILSTPLVGGGTMINSLMSGGVVSGAQVNNSTINNSNITGAFTGTVNNAIISGGTASLDTLTVSNSLTVSATQLVLPGPQDYTSDTITFNSYQNNYGMAHKLNNWLLSNSGVGVTGGWALGNGGLWSPPDYYNEIVNPVIRLGADTDGFFGSVTFETGTQGLTINSHQYSQPNRLTVNSSTVSFNGIVSGTFTGDGSGLTNLPPVPAATGTTLGGVIVGKNLMVSNGTLGLDHVLLDDGGMASLIPFNRMLVDGGEAPAVNWGSRELKAPSNITAFNWNTGTFGIPVYGYFTGSFSGNGAGLTVNAANVEGTFNTLLASTGSISSFDASNAYVSYLYVNQNISANDIGFNMISGSSINLTQNGNLTAGDGSQLFSYNSGAAFINPALITGGNGAFSGSFSGNASLTGSFSGTASLAGTFAGDGSGLTNLPLATGSTVGVVIPGAGLTVNNGLVDVSVLKYDSENNNIIGYTSIINGDRSVALGYNSTIYLNGYTLARNVVIGYNAVISCNDSVAIGPNSRGTGYNVVAIGYEAEASNGSVAIGFRANGNSENAVAIGYEAEASVFNSFAVGFRAIASGSESIQLGQGTNNIASTLQFLNQPVINSNMQLPLIIKGFNPLNSTAAPNLSVPITVANADSEPYWTIDATNQTGGTILDFTIMPNNSRLVMLVISGTAPAVFEFPTGSRQSGGGGNVYTGVANQTDRILVEKVNNTQYYLTVTRNYQ